MKVAVAMCLILAVGFAQGGLLSSTLMRTPSLDSAVIKSDRVGGNFAYSTVEGHAYTAVSPVVQRVVEPVSVSYTAHQVPLGYASVPFHHHVVAAPSYITHPFFGHPGISFAPSVISGRPIFGSPIGEYPSSVVADAPVPAPAQSPSQVAIDEDTVAIESA